MSVSIKVGKRSINITAQPLSQEAFAPFGDVISNPRPDIHPSAFAQHKLPSNASSANQGSAIRYGDVSRLGNHYAQAPSRTGEPKMSMFVCAARPLETLSDGFGRFTVKLLERHPFTTQTFTPLPSSASQYLVIVAPSLTPSAQDEGLPVPEGLGLPGRGLPDPSKLRAFVADKNQAVTYGAGTWHAPMVVLGKEGTAIDFVVFQHASGQGTEDWQRSTYTMAAEITTDVLNKLEDTSGIICKPGENPYAAFINACNNDRREIEALYTAHRTKRNVQQKDKFLSPDFKELFIDQTLLRLEKPEIQPGFKDERHCMALWSRPPSHIIRLATHIQRLLLETCPEMWLMSPWNMHMTTLEVAFSKTPTEIADLVASMRSSLPSIVNHTHNHRARLVKPMISYDLSAFALSFVPATGEPPLSPAPAAPDTAENIVQGDEYTYHHVRMDIFDKVQKAGVEVGSRYQVPSAHITLGRYITQAEHDTPEKRQAWVDRIDEINAWLEKEVWDEKDSDFIGEWMVGQERSIDARIGTIWYGGGRTLVVGEGF
ncbi:uncharacterized protein J7T54_005542 [Emericellopsis cladophorae]|uniref:Ureidoglycolate hydrolase n=1 Tax=Emericellopsis cladophorae TaxID=2686198 RepID=A0A9P9Y5B0_9HYPO|nr:uncharacterized protein J7T54_005542 [Emericellopsis cladophorae]KAI6783513.1 hypothetical protein J7T54_005542 [Emericellopsis cladophorae]